MLVRFAKSVSSSASCRRSCRILASGQSGAPVSPSNVIKGFSSSGISPPEHKRSIVGPPRRHLYSSSPVSTRFRDDGDPISVASTLSEAGGQRLRVAVDVDEGEVWQGYFDTYAAAENHPCSCMQCLDALCTLWTCSAKTAMIWTMT